MSWWASVSLALWPGSLSRQDLCTGDQNCGVVSQVKMSVAVSKNPETATPGGCAGLSGLDSSQLVSLFCPEDVFMVPHGHAVTGCWVEKNAEAPSAGARRSFFKAFLTDLQCPHSKRTAR